MKRIYDDEKEEQEYQEFDKAKIIVTVVTFVLILLILAITLFVGSRKKEASDTDRLQQDIMDYADKENMLPGETESMSDAVLNGSEEAAGKEESREEESPAPTKEPVPTPTPYHPIMEKAEVDYSKIKFDEQKNLKEMMTYWADNNQAALDDLANLDWFRAMSWSLRNTRENYYCGAVNSAGKPEGLGIAVYGDNQYYYGEWKNGVRSGKGTWIHYHFHTKENTSDLYTYHQYVGMWKDDLPDGEGQEHYDFETELLKENTRYISNRIGTYKQGLVDGEFYMTSIDDQDSMKEWEAHGSEGKWIYYGDAKDNAGRRPAFLDLNPDNKEESYFWLTAKENRNVGVPCLISKSKN